VLDPRQRSHDWNALNNNEKRGLFGSRSRSLVRLDNPTRQESRRDRVVSALLPLLWYNDFGGVTGAVHARSNYLGRFEKNVGVYSYAFDPDARHREGFYFRFGNPVSHPMPRTEASLAGWSLEGRAGIAVHADRSLRRSLAFGSDPHIGFDATWMAVSDLAYVDRRLWDNAGTIEAGPWASVTSRTGNRVWRARVGVRGGVVYRNPGAGVQSTTRYDIEGFARTTGEVSLRTPFLGVRLFGGTYLAQNVPVLQRRIMLAGADPYTTFTNPLLRSGGALFVRPGFHYQAPGDGNLRGFRADLGGRWVLALNVEGTKTVYRRANGGALAGVTLETFADAV